MNLIVDILYAVINPRIRVQLMTTEITPVAAQNATRTSALREFWYYFSMNRGAVIGLVVFVLLVLIAIFAPLHRATSRPKSSTRTPSSCRPSWQTGGDPRFLLGTDPVGRDILSRLIHGARYSLLIGAVVVVHLAGRRHHRSACSPAISAAGSMSSSCA